MKAIVIGAGIGGTSAALALLRQGIEVELYEQAPRLLPLGAGLSLWGNAVLCLDELGLGERVIAAGTVVEAAEVRTESGRLLTRLSTAEFRRRLGRPTVAVRRGVLQESLVSALPEGILRTGHELASFTQDGSGVTARFTNGHEARGDVLVGADGLRSKVRQAVLKDGPPRYAGYSGWLALVPFSHPALPPGLGVEWWGRGKRFGALPVGGGEVYWYAGVNRAEPLPAVRPGRKADVLAAVRGFQPPVEELVEATDEGRIVELSFWDRDPVRRWGEGRMTLLGDAAHPMTPNIGQGACQAIEDALALADLLRHAVGPESALREYERRRIRRTSPFVRQSRRIGRVAQRSDAPSVWARNLLFRAVPARLTLGRMAKQFRRPVSR